MKIYTKTGDKGTTALFGGTRVPKHHLRIESYGTLDELNSYIGLVRDTMPAHLHQREQLLQIQDDLFRAGALLATPVEDRILKNGKSRLNMQEIEQSHIDFLEHAIDEMDAQLPAMTHFVLPGGHPNVSHCHIARCICRRAERLTVQLAETEEVDALILAYLNRLSDYLFVLARLLTKENGAEEIKWIPR